MAKTRLGFVSNSSSSSFILSTEDINDKLKVEIDLEFLLNYVTERNYDVIKTKEELIYYIWNQYVWVDEKNKGLSKEEQMKICFKDEGYDYNYKECLESINDGQIVIVADVENNDSELFSNILENSNIKMISGGY